MPHEEEGHTRDAAQCCHHRMVRSIVQDLDVNNHTKGSFLFISFTAELQQMYCRRYPAELVRTVPLQISKCEIFNTSSTYTFYLILMTRLVNERRPAHIEMGNTQMQMIRYPWQQLSPQSPHILQCCRDYRHLCHSNSFLQPHTHTLTLRQDQHTIVHHFPLDLNDLKDKVKKWRLIGDNVASPRADTHEKD